MKSWQWRGVLAGIVGGALACALLPGGLRVVAFAVVTAACSAIALDVPRRDPDLDPAHWALFAGGFGLFAVSAIVGYFEADDQIGAWALPLRALAIAAIAFGLWALMCPTVSTGRRDFIDPVIVAIGAVMVSWVLVLDPIARQSDLGWVDQAVAMATPVLDIVLLAVAIRFVLALGPGGPSRRLLLGGVAAFLLGNGINSFGTVAAGVGGEGLVTALWAIGMGLIALAGRVPDAGNICEPDGNSRDQLGVSRLVLFGLAASAGPVALIARLATGEDVNVPVILGGTLLLTVLVLLRMGGVLGSLASTVSRYRDATTREKTLRHAAHQLVAATDRATIFASAVDAAHALVRDRPAVLVQLFVRSADGSVLTLVGTRGGVRTADVTIPVSALPGRLMQWLGGGDASLLDIADDEVAPDIGRILGLSDERPSCLIAPLVVDDDVSGFLAVALERAPGDARRRAVETVASQAALAVETIDLADHLRERAGEERFRALVQNASDVIIVTSPGGIIEYATPSITAMAGYDPALLPGRSISKLLHPDDAARGPGVLIDGHVVDWRLREAGGGFRSVEVIVADLRDDPNVGGLVLTMRDVTERRELESRLAHQAFHDTLTGLSNRALFEDRLGQALARRVRGKLQEVAVIFIDLDDFKGINDTLGHQAGDELLRAAARRLVSCLRPTDTAARMGGDEFAVAVEIDQFDADRAVSVVAGRILQALKAPYVIDGNEVFSRGSLGIAVTPDAGITVDDLLRNADVAMYVSKKSGKGRYKRYEEGMHAPVLRQMELKGELGRAIERDELVLHYQPIVDLGTGRLAGIEALVRWNHPEQGLIGPAEFIPLAEDAGLMGSMGRWILGDACRAFQELLVANPRFNGYVSVNLSGRQIHHGDIVGELTRVLAMTGLDPARLLLELTESVLVDDTERAIGRITALKALGVRIAIDDFGTGFSSLAYLRRLPVDVLKLASPFVQGLGSGQEPLTESILRLAETLGMDVIAEGIERPEQLQALRRLGCGVGQGYLFSRPVTMPRIAELARTGIAGSDAPPVPVVETPTD